MLSSSDSYENYFFYWLAPRPADLAKDNSSSDTTPLIIYLNGGPGSSSMNALWTGNGPLRAYPKDSQTKGDDFEVKYDTTVSWQAAGDLLWIDQPAGTGWSTGQRIVTSLDEIADEFVTFLLSFYEEYPQYKTRELVLTGESFAGKYLSYSSRAILDYNDKQEEGAFKFDLRNLMLSNPLVDTPTERLQQPQVGWALGLYDDFQTE
jgi:carboxypeptidase D